ncbi:unnamed protein product [Leptosia nina]|uniref:Uncharacterized protein n=1 Tax=Leptosia nina TaxID=320188 RepID=A0AAV1J5E1_9NEOP
MSLNLCRICLESRATLPLFDSVTEKNDLLTKLEYCVKESINDVDGHPRHICSACNEVLHDLYKFIKKFQESCVVLQNNSIVKLERLDFSDDDYSGKIEVEIKQENRLEQSSDDELLSAFKNVVEKKTKVENKTTVAKTKRQKKSPLISTNNIASSILEGEYMWIGETWCIKPRNLSMPVKKENAKLQAVVKKKRVQIKLPKVVKENTPKLCDLCGMTFKNQDSLAIHKRKVHFQSPVKCTECPRVLCSNYYFQRHMKRCHSSNKNFICSTCGATFAFVGELKRHIKNVHNKHLIVKKEFRCNLCDKVFKCNKSVVVHTRSAHTGYRPAQCTVCDSSFYHEDYLREHMRLHTGETPFKCPICNRGYAQRGNMKSHLRIHRLSEVDASVLSKMKPNYVRLLKQ